MTKVNLGLVILLFLISCLTWPYQNIFAKNLFSWYLLFSSIITISFIFSLFRENKTKAIQLIIILLSGLIAWSSYQDTFPPKNYFPLDQNSANYLIEKRDGYYSLCYSLSTEKLCGYIGSSVHPLDKFVGQKIHFSASWRSDWGKPMCFTDNCQIPNNRTSVIDILEIN